MTLRHLAPTSALALLLLAPIASAQEDRGPKTLSRGEIEQGWILLFDGETTFGWAVKDSGGQVTVEDGILTARGPATITTTTRFGPFDLRFRARTEGVEREEGAWVRLSWSQDEGERSFGYRIDPSAEAGRDDFEEYRIHLTEEGMFGEGLREEDAAGCGPQQERIKVEIIEQPAGGEPTPVPAVPIAFEVPEGRTLSLGDVALRPRGMEPLFHGKDLSGWKVLEGGTSVYSVTEEGALNVKNGRGDIQTEGQYDDFILQLDVFSNGEHLNSGIFLRAIPGEFWSGYESQIRNEFEGDDRTKPVDFGTGAIYRRQAARKVVANDFEWFTKTIVAHDNHFAVWVDGYQVSDWTDDREPADNGRNGYKATPGVISIQGHDPTTDLSFRNIRIAELPGG